MQVSRLELEELGISPREVDRLTKTFSLVPKDAANALEIGFYDLRITRILRKQISLTSIDLPRPIESDDRSGLAFADVKALPFVDRQFDLVLCTEVLEHLEEDVLRIAVSELARVTGKYLLVSVPYRQRIDCDMFKCRVCGYVGNTMGHVQTFAEDRVRDLFGGMRLLSTELIGTVSGKAPDWLYRLARRVGNVWYDYSFGPCPTCGRTERAVRENVAGYVLRRVLWRIEARSTPQPAWIAMLFQSVGASTEAAPKGVRTDHHWAD